MLLLYIANMSSKYHNDYDDDDGAVDDTNQKMMTIDLKDSPNDGCLFCGALVRNDANYKGITSAQTNLSCFTETYNASLQLRCLHHLVVMRYVRSYIYVFS